MTKKKNIPSTVKLFIIIFLFSNIIISCGVSQSAKKTNELVLIKSLADSSDFSKIDNLYTSSVHEKKELDVIIYNSFLPVVRELTFEEFDSISSNMQGSNFNQLFKTEKKLIDEEIRQDVLSSSAEDLNIYYNFFPDRINIIDEVLYEVYYHQLDSLNYFQLRTLHNNLAKFNIANDIELLKAEKRNQVLEEIITEIDSISRFELTVVDFHKSHLKKNIDNYFYPAFDKFCDEYFDMGSGFYRLYASTKNLIIKDESILQDFVDDWYGHISLKKISGIISDSSNKLDNDLITVRDNFNENLNLLLTDYINVYTQSSDKKIGIRFKGQDKLSKSYATKEALIEAADYAVDGVAVAVAIPTAGLSLAIVESVKFVGFTGLSMYNESSAQKSFKELYEKSVNVSIKQYYDTFLKNQKVYYTSLKKEVNEKL